MPCSGLPAVFYRDWLPVAGVAAVARVVGEEALHFGLLTGHLRTLGHANTTGG